MEDTSKPTTRPVDEAVLSKTELKGEEESKSREEGLNGPSDQSPDNASKEKTKKEKKKEKKDKKKETADEKDSQRKKRSSS